MLGEVEREKVFSVGSEIIENKVHKHHWSEDQQQEAYLALCEFVNTVEPFDYKNTASFRSALYHRIEAAARKVEKADELFYECTEQTSNLSACEATACYNPDDILNVIETVQEFYDQCTTIQWIHTGYAKPTRGMVMMFLRALLSADVSKYRTACNRSWWGRPATCSRSGLNSWGRVISSAYLGNLRSRCIKNSGACFDDIPPECYGMITPIVNKILNEE